MGGFFAVLCVVSLVGAAIIAAIMYLPVRAMLRYGIVKGRLGAICAYVGLTQAITLPFFLPVLYESLTCEPFNYATDEGSKSCGDMAMTIIVYGLGGICLALLIIVPLIAARMVKVPTDTVKELEI